MPSPEAIDLLICARWVIPVEPHGIILENHAIAVKDGVILAVLPSEEALQRFATTERVDLAEHVLIPGLVNLHTHAAMALMRGIADDLPLMRWLQEAIWPTEGEHMSAEFVRDGTTLAAAEMLRAGTTCASDMYFFPDAAAEAFSAAGMRAVIGLTVLEFPNNYATDGADHLRKGLAARDKWREHPLIDFTLAPHAPYTVSNSSFNQIIALAHELSLPVHLHLHETHQEIADSLKTYGKRPLARLEKLGLLDTDLIAVHAVHLEQSEIELLARHNAIVAHCPSSNMKLASGIAPTTAMAEAGLAFGLGTDGAASNNRMSLLQEMRQAGLLAKLASGNAAALPAHALLRAATLDGARALRMDDRIGSISIGKQADLTAIALNTPETIPCYDPAAHIAYAAGSENVSHVWVSGKARVFAHCLLQTNNNELLHRSRLWQTRLKI